MSVIKFADGEWVDTNTIVYFSEDSRRKNATNESLSESDLLRLIETDDFALLYVMQYDRSNISNIEKMKECG